MSGDSLSNPPKLKPGEYGTWVVKFESHVLATDGEVWQVIEQGRKIIPDPNDATKEKLRAFYTKEDYKSIEKPAKAMKVLHAALEPGDMQKVSHLKCPKEIWLTLKRIYEGSDDVKKNRVLAAQTELFNLRQAKNENVHEFHSRFQGCVSNLANLEKRYEQWEINHMFLRGLSSDWNDIVRTMQALAHTKQLTLEDLVAKLDSNMLLDKDREPQKVSRQIALSSKGEKSKSSKDKESTEKAKSKSSSKFDDELALLTQALRVAKERRGEVQEPRGSSKRSPTQNDECFYCKKKGHFQKDCRKKKRDESQKEKEHKSKDDKSKYKKAMCAWGGAEGSVADSDLELESKYQTSGKGDVCLMAEEGSSNSEVSFSSDDSNSPNTDTRSGLLEIIRQLVAANDELKDIIAEQQARIGEMFEESHQRAVRIRQLEKQLASAQRPTAKSQVKEPAEQEVVTVPKGKKSRPGLGYGEVTMMKRPQKAGQPRSTPRPKIDLHDNAKAYGKGFHIWNRYAKDKQSETINFSKQKKKVTEWQKTNFKKEKLCYHCGQNGHLWNKCPGKTFQNKVQRPLQIGKQTTKKKADRQTSLKKDPRPSTQKKVSEPRTPNRRIRSRGNQVPKTNTNSISDVHINCNFPSSNTRPKAAKLVWVRKN